jgi:hypothetical protein
VTRISHNSGSGSGSGSDRGQSGEFSPLERLCTHGQGALFRDHIAARLELPDLANLRTTSSCLKGVIDALKPVIRAFKPWVALRDVRDDRAMTYHCTSARPKIAFPKARELFAIYAGYGALRVLSALDSK